MMIERRRASSWKILQDHHSTYQVNNDLICTALHRKIYRSDVRSIDLIYDETNTTPINNILSHLVGWRIN